MTRVSLIDDGLIKGELLRKTDRCPICFTRAYLIRIDQITLPKGLEPSHRLILYYYSGAGDLVRHDHIGVTCGCLSRVHRQMAHITDRKKS